MDKEKEFEFVIPKIKLNKNNDLELRKKILKMTPEGRDQVLTNLHYGTSRRIYQKERLPKYIKKFI